MPKLKQSKLPELNEKLHTLPGFKTVRILPGDPIEIFVEFGRKRSVCPKCDGVLIGCGHRNKLVYDNAYFGKSRRFRIKFQRFRCKSCNRTCYQSPDSLPGSVLQLKNIMVTRRLRNYIGANCDKQISALAKKTGCRWLVVKKTRDSINGRSG